MWLRADVQTGGRGRQGRSWVSPPGNLFASTLVRLRPHDPPPQTLAFVAAVALDQVVAAYLAGQPVTIKWPNDLLVGDAKLSGILLERVEDAVIVGFGVNLAHAPDVPERRVTSFPALGLAAPDRADFLTHLAEAFARWLDRWRGEGFSAVRSRWLERSFPRGTPIKVHDPAGVTIEGLFDGIDGEGALRLRLAGGGTRVMHAGDVFLL